MPFLDVVHCGNASISVSKVCADWVPAGTDIYSLVDQYAPTPNGRRVSLCGQNDREMEGREGEKERSEVT